VIESYVDLTYRGLALGRRVRLSQVRPSSGYLELPAPMPVGTPLALTTDDGLTFDATVVWIYEQVAGSDHAPGMIVAPALGGAAAAWWTARVSLPDDEEPPRSAVAGGRSRPLTVRPRSHTDPIPPAGAPTRATTADAPAPDEASAASTMVMPVLAAEPVAAGDAELGEHDVIDDGKATMIMASIDPAALGVDVAGEGDGGQGPEDDGDDGDDDIDPAGEFADQVTIPDGAGLPPSRRKKRKSRR